MIKPTTLKVVNDPSSFRVTVSVDNNHCHLYAICVQEAPEVFELSVDGRLRYQAKPAMELYEKVWNAARLCPMQAISIEPSATISISNITKTSGQNPLSQMKIEGVS